MHARHAQLHRLPVHTVQPLFERNNELKQVGPLLRGLLSRRTTPVSMPTAAANIDA